METTLMELARSSIVIWGSRDLVSLNFVVNLMSLELSFMLQFNFKTLHTLSYIYDEIEQHAMNYFQ